MEHTHFYPLKALAIAGALLVPSIALAQSSWDPTLLVNTESFQTIDEGDGTTDIELRFGGNASGTLLWNVNGKQFEFSDDVQVQGNLTASGTLSVVGDADTRGNLTVNSDAGATNATVTFGNASGSETITFSHALQRFFLSTGATIQGHLSGASLTISSLKNCDTIDTDAFGNLVCGVDQSGSGGTVTQIQADDRYVNVSGDTMTGALIISNGQGLTASGNIVTNNNITINSNNSAADAVLTFGNDLGAETITFSDTTNAFEFSDDINVHGQMSGSSLSTAGGNVTIGADGTTVFNENGNDVDFRIEGDTNPNLFFLDASTDRIGIGTATPETELEVVGTISGSNMNVSNQLTVNGNATFNSTVTFNGVTYTWPATQASGSGKVLSVDPVTGQLTWTDTASTLGNTSGSILSLAPEYANAAYFGSGSATTGQLRVERTAAENYYHWTTSKSSLQDYWISVKVRVPDNFVSWDSAAPLEFRYRTGTASAAQNHLTVRFFDTAGTEIALTGNAGLTSTSFATANISGPQSSGTYTPGSYITAVVKVAATTAGSADAGYLEFNWNTSF